MNAHQTAPIRTLVRTKKHKTCVSEFPPNGQLATDNKQNKLSENPSAIALGVTEKLSSATALGHVSFSRLQPAVAALSPSGSKGMIIYIVREKSLPRQLSTNSFPSRADYNIKPTSLFSIRVHMGQSKPSGDFCEITNYIPHSSNNLFRFGDAGHSRLRPNVHRPH
jgi:hypothetical protein